MASRGSINKTAISLLSGNMDWENRTEEERPPGGRGPVMGILDGVAGGEINAYHPGG